jgi:predicted patatin/cPLA2 family phospholipase
MTEENHQLCDYLNETLPTLSLDPETYLPYITGCLDTFQDEDDEFDEIIALLQASSESHSDDEQIWPKLKEEILRRHEEFNHEVEQQKKQNEDERRAIEAAKKKLDTEDAYREKERKRLA